jgi:hypothetical protein|tara:strand:+ start:3623 stop:4048 length:426 start_codon:yes stop_codon:yes gene_type:complete
MSSNPLIPENPYAPVAGYTRAGDVTVPDNGYYGKAVAYNPRFSENQDIDWRGMYDSAEDARRPNPQFMEKNIVPEFMKQGFTGGGGEAYTPTPQQQFTVAPEQAPVQAITNRGSSDARVGVLRSTAADNSRSRIATQNQGV